MANNYQQPGRAVTVTVGGSAVDSGQGVLIGDALFGVALNNIPANGTGEILTEGVVTLVASKAIAIGKRVYWSSGKVTDAAGDAGIGIALSAAAKDGDPVNVKLVTMTKPAT